MTQLLCTDNFVTTGPGTVGGNYLRQYWQPVYDGDRLKKGQATPIEIMSEKFTLFRGDSGRPYVVSSSCPHRNTQLSSGWVEGDSIRCLYHGWKFGSDGRCVEQPAEPRPFCEKVSIKSYPTQEKMGLVFAYFGVAPCPPLPSWPEFEAECCVSSLATIPCNYFQSAENIVDYAHASFVHRPVSKLGRSAQGKISLERFGGGTHIEQLDYGIRIYQTDLMGLEGIYYMMPNVSYVSYCLGNVVPGEKSGDYKMQTLFWYVPIDDVSHLHVMVTVGVPEVIQMMKEEKKSPHSIADDIAKVLGAGADLHKDQERVLRRPDMVRLQDGVTIVGQGAVADRSREHLGATDAGVVLLRRLWRRELEKYSRGILPGQFIRPVELR